MFVQLADDDRLLISPTSHEHDGFVTGFFWFAGLFLLAFVSWSGSIVALLIMAPVIAIALLVAAAPLVSSEQVWLDRRLRKVNRLYRWMSKRTMSQWDFDDFASVVVTEGTEHVPRVGHIPAFCLSLERRSLDKAIGYLTLGEPPTLEEATSIANRISRYAGWPVRMDGPPVLEKDT